jgi:phosphotriesterase-related protein
MKIHTVTGEISDSECGVTLPHEHLLFNGICLLSKPNEASKIALAYAPITMENLGELRRDALISRDNLVQLDVELAIKELTYFKRAGGNTLVDMTTKSVGRDPIALKAISIATGVNIVMGCGYYFEAAVPFIKDLSIEDIESSIEKDLMNGVGDTGIKSGVIGEIGTSGPMTENEKKVLQASARAHLKTHAPIWVHPNAFYEDHEQTIHQILDIIEQEGVQLTRVAMCHIDETGLNLDFHRSIMKRGAYISYDTFGSEGYYDNIYDNIYAHEQYDAHRVEAIAKLVNEGYTKQLLISQDVGVKIQLKKYGGYGYDHILKHIVPMFKRQGVKDNDIHSLLVDNPTMILAF